MTNNPELDWSYYHQYSRQQDSRARNEPSRRFHIHGGPTCWDHLLVLSHLRKWKLGWLGKILKAASRLGTLCRVGAFNQVKALVKSSQRFVESSTGQRSLIKQHTNICIWLPSDLTWPHIGFALVLHCVGWTVKWISHNSQYQYCIIVYCIELNRMLDKVALWATQFPSYWC